MSTDTLQEPQTFARSSGQITIEIGTHKCSDVMFPPLRKTLRGRFSRYKFSGHFDANEYPLLAKLEHIPGAHVSVDISAKRGRVFDPLSLKKNADLNREVMAAFKQLTGADHRSFNETTVDLSGKDNLATWVHWMHELVTREKATLVEGTFPKTPDGRVQVDFFNSSRGAPKYQDQFTDEDD